MKVLLLFLSLSVHVGIVHAKYLGVDITVESHIQASRGDIYVTVNSGHCNARGSRNLDTAYKIARHDAVSFSCQATGDEATATVVVRLDGRVLCTVKFVNKDYTLDIRDQKFVCPVTKKGIGFSPTNLMTPIKTWWFRIKPDESSDYD